MPQKLPFISDEILFREVEKVLKRAQEAVRDVEPNLHKNKIDPFSAVFDSYRQWIPLEEWIEQEKARQIQKTMQNALGDFHQAILGNMDGWVDLGVGEVGDVRNDSAQIVAEVKNKYNTTKGNHKKVIYDDLLSLINSVSQGYTGYYVEIIPSTKRPYNKEFMPSDNETHTRRPKNDRIRIIDGRSFYALASGTPDALERLYKVLPEVILEVMGLQDRARGEEPMLDELFERVFPKLITN